MYFLYPPWKCPRLFRLDWLISFRNVFASWSRFRLFLREKRSLKSHVKQMERKLTVFRCLKELSWDKSKASPPEYSCWHGMARTLSTIQCFVLPAVPRLFDIHGFEVPFCCVRRDRSRSILSSPFGKLRSIDFRL